MIQDASERLFFLTHNSPEAKPLVGVLGNRFLLSAHEANSMIARLATPFC